jgi:hypothetical protein
MAKDKFRPLLFNLMTLLASSAFALLALEGVLRLLNTPGWDTEVRSGWRATNKDGPVNQLGYRGAPIAYGDRDFVVVMLGDSHVESLACPLEGMPERALERHLQALDSRYKVFTIGSSGYGNDQEYLALQEYFRNYRADAVALWLTPTNDVWNNLFPTHMPKDGAIKPTYWLENGELKGPDHQLGELIREPAKTKIGAMLNKIFHPQKGLDESWERRLPPPYKPLTEFHGPYLTDWDPADPANGNPAMVMENLATEKTHFSLHLSPRSKRMDYGLALTRKLVSAIEELVQSHNGQFFIFQPTPPSKTAAADDGKSSEPVAHKVGNLYYLSSDAQTYENYKYLIDGFKLLAVPLTLEKWKVSETDSHLNCAANDQVMRGLAEKLVEQTRAGRPPSAP